MNLLMNMSLNDFNNLLASNAPAPGGGSTAALSGVLASSLTMMVVNLSRGKKSYEALDVEIKNKISADYESVRLLNQQLIELVDEDSMAFNQVMEAFKLPRQTEHDRIQREQSIETAGQYALKIPLTVAAKCLSVLTHQVDIARYGNKNAVSDIGVGALMASAGLEGAALNVRINIPGIKNQSVVTDAIQKIEEYLPEGEKLKTRIISIVNSRIYDSN